MRAPIKVTTYEDDDGTVVCLTDVDGRTLELALSDVEGLIDDLLQVKWRTEQQGAQGDGWRGVLRGLKA